MKEITKDKLNKYFEVTGKALKKVKESKISDKPINKKEASRDFLDMAQRYYDDAKHFMEKR